MSAGRTLVEGLAAAADGLAPRDRRRKVSLLDRLARCPIGEPAVLLRFHEIVCYLQAYPDGPDVLARVETALAGFAARVERLGAAARARLEDSGIAATTLRYPFGLPMTRWLVARFGRDADVDWRAFTDADRLDEALSLIVTRAEDDALTEGGPGWRRWLRLAKGGRRLTDLELLVELFDRPALPEEAREWLFESVGLPVRWRLRQASRTLARLPVGEPFFHRATARLTPRRFLREVERPIRGVRRAPPGQAGALIECARRSLATRLRELHAFSHANPADVLVADPGRGLRIALIGLLPRFRLPLEAYYAFLVLKNGVPVSYGGGWWLFGALELGLNIFPTFRRGESAFITSQILRVYRQVLPVRTVVLDRHQIGGDNTEALRSGALYFYRRLGFAPDDPAVRTRLAEEERKIARDPAYRTPLAVLRRLTRGAISLPLRGGGPARHRRLKASTVAVEVSRRIATEFGGDRAAAVRVTAARVARSLGATGWRRWPAEERRAFEGLALVAALIPDLARWPGAERRALAEVLRAKGGESERAYARRLHRHRRLRRHLEEMAE